MLPLKTFSIAKIAAIFIAITTSNGPALSEAISDSPSHYVEPERATRSLPPAHRTLMREIWQNVKTNKNCPDIEFLSKQSANANLLWSAVESAYFDNSQTPQRNLIGYDLEAGPTDAAKLERDTIASTENIILSIIMRDTLAHFGETYTEYVEASFKIRRTQFISDQRKHTPAEQT